MYARLIINYRHHIKKDRLKRFSGFQTTFYQMMRNITCLTSRVPQPPPSDFGQTTTCIICLFL
ncbi:hypothetical protein HMPREF1051_0049 [Neisseria sicca VK64]|uniref:Uncharacterized protein n=1 Tax=Neisseria sicca VK64 TaxID=1095748 RepID=I2NSH4_NEISI|nr:hypothetical protein HMPREF1051_0049 [Neisseria sicca VK64]